jgi:GTP-binding protein HflX
MKSIQFEEYEQDGNLLIDIRMQQVDWSRLEKREGAVLSDFIVH